MTLELTGDERSRDFANSYTDEMMDTKFDCFPESVVGRLLMRNLRECEELAEGKFDKDFVVYMKRNHGGIPKRQWAVTKRGTVIRVGRFLNYGGPYKKPKQENWLNPSDDLRTNWEFDMVTADANFGEGCGEFLVPFALLYQGKSHPDEMVTKHLDAVCFDFSSGGTPSVVYWNNSDALSEYSRCEEEGLSTYSELDHSRFTEPLARSFKSFMNSLRAKKPRKK